MKGKVSGYIFLLALFIGGCIFFRNNTKEAAKQEITTAVLSIDKLTDEAVVVPYVRKNGKLPDYYITKSEARKTGWDASKGNLCEILPGKAIGGDVFFNREGSLPVAERRKWFEADLNYHCGRRNASRLLYSSDGLIYVTYDHYKTFEKR